MTETDKTQPGTITLQQAAKLLLLTPGRIAQLVTDGFVPPPVSRNRYLLVGCVQGYIRFLKDEERRTSRVQAESSLKAARQRDLELRIAQRQGKLVDSEDSEAVFANTLATLRHEIEGCGAAVTRDRDMRGRIDEYLDHAFGRASAKFAHYASELRAGRDPFGDGNE